MALGADIFEAIVKQSGRPLREVIEAFTKFIPRIEAARPPVRVTPASAPVPRAAAPVSAPAPRAAAPEPQVPVVRQASEQVEQLSLMPQMREQTTAGLLKYRGRYQSPTGPKDVNVETVQRSLAPRVELPSNPLPGDVPPPVRIPDPWASRYGQQLELEISPYGALRGSAPRTPETNLEFLSSPLRGVGELDAGTLRSLQDLSQRASRQYGIPADEIFSRITKPGGTDFLNELAGRNALQNIVGRITSRTGLSPEAANKLLAGLGTTAGVGGLGVLGYQIGRPKDVPSELETAAPAAVLPVTTEEVPPAPILPEAEVLARTIGADTSETPVILPRRDLVPLGERPGERPFVPVAQKPVGAPILEPGGDLAAYYKQRSEYAQQPAVRQELVEFVTRGLEGQQARDLATWAKQNPHLAYELKRRAMADPDQSLQTNQNTTSSALSTELGTDNSNNAQGSADAVSSSVMNPSAGNYDMMAATRPLEKPVLLGAQQARNYAEGSLETGETFADKLLRMAARRQQIA